MTKPHVQHMRPTTRIGSDWQIAAVLLWCAALISMAVISVAKACLDA